MFTLYLVCPIKLMISSNSRLCAIRVPWPIRSAVEPSRDNLYRIRMSINIWINYSQWYIAVTLRFLSQAKVICGKNGRHTICCTCSDVDARRTNKQTIWYMVFLTKTTCAQSQKRIKHFIKCKRIRFRFLRKIAEFYLLRRYSKINFEYGIHRMSII